MRFLKKKPLAINSYHGLEDILVPEPEMAKELLRRAVDYITQTENLTDDEQFEEQKESLIKIIKELNDKISPDYKQGVDYSSIQRELSDTVRTMIPIESTYRTKIYKCRTKLQKSIPNNMGWALLSALTMGIVKKKKK